MPVFTILNCGTNFDRSKRGELIADFGAQMEGDEYKTFLITDGVGSKGSKANPMPGTFDPFSKSKGAKGKSPSWSQTPMQTLQDVSKSEAKFSPSGHGIVRSLAGNKTNSSITGDGWDDNIRHAIAALSEACPTLSGKVNMIGWSRGAVTCVRMANWIKEFLGTGFEINIFAVDPVAGLDAGERLHDTYLIPDTVKNYVGILALDEMRGDFRPQDLTRIQVQSIFNTNVAFLPFPGVHNTAVTMRDGKLPEVTRMVRFLAYRFLQYHGTRFSKDEPQYSRGQACKVYADMMLKREKYAGMFSKGFVNKQMGGIVERTVRQDVQNYVGADAHFFVNEHHRACFASTFPDIYNYFFTTRVGEPNGKVTTSYLPPSYWGQKFQQFMQADASSFALIGKVYTLEQRMKPALWKVSPPGIGSTPVPAPPCATAVVQTLL